MTYAWCRPCRSWDTYFVFWCDLSQRPQGPGQRNVTPIYDIECAVCGQSATPADVRLQGGRPDAQT